MGHGARVKAHTSDEDLGWRNIEKQVRLVRKNPYVMIGVQEGAGTHKPSNGKDTGKNPVTVALVASVHEFGSAKHNIPERSFIRSTMDQHASEFHAATESLLNQIIDGNQTVDKALKILGLLIQSKIKKKIQSNIAPALKAETIARRTGGSGGSVTALMDSNQLINSILYLVIMENAGFSDASDASGEIDMGSDD